MTLSSTQTKQPYGGNGSTTEYSIPFMFMRNEDIEVVLTDVEGFDSILSLGTDYQITGAGEQDGGKCTMSVPPEAGQKLLIRRSPAIIQETDYLENQAFPAASHEAALDNLTMICQALSERLDRTISFKISSAVTGVELPEPDGGRMLAWNDSGDNLANRDIADFDGVLLPLSITNGGTGGETATEALMNLGFGAAGRDVGAAETSLEALAAIDAEQADPAILRADTPDLLYSVYGSEAQVHTGTDLSELTVSRNHVAWTLTETSQFSEVNLPYPGTYVFHIYPNGNSLALASSYKTDDLLNDPDATAGEIRIVVEKFSSRKTIVSLQNMEA